jgi:splicing factor 3B subunit 3
MAYRGAYFPVKGCIDGDLCEQFFSLDSSQQRSVADELDRTVSEVCKKIEDMRYTRLI